MAQNITIQGASYTDVPAVKLPKTGGGQATFTDTSDASLASSSSLLSGVTAYSSGTKYTGSLIIQHYYTGTSTPSAGLGVNGDIYLQTS